MTELLFLFIIFKGVYYLQRNPGNEAAEHHVWQEAPVREAVCSAEGIKEVEEPILKWVTENQ